MAKTLRARLIQAARTTRALPDVRTRTVRSLLHGAPEFCEPDTTVAEAAGVMAAKDLSAILVRTRDGLGIVTDVDLRDKVVAARASFDGPVSAIMTTPVQTVGADTLAPEASIAMLETGVNHLPVVDAQGDVLGVLSASSLMTLDALSPFALRHSLLAAYSQEELVENARDIPKLFVDLVDANLAAPDVMRIVTSAERRHGDAPRRNSPRCASARRRRDTPGLLSGAPGAASSRWSRTRTTGSPTRTRDDPEADEYFRALAEEVNAGVELCGFPADAHGVVARLADVAPAGLAAGATSSRPA